MITATPTLAVIMPATHPLKGRFQVAEKIGVFPIDRALSPDQHIVVPRPTGQDQDAARHRAQPALDAVAPHGITDLSAHGETDAHIALRAVRARFHPLVFRRGAASRSVWDLALP